MKFIGSIKDSRMHFSAQLKKDRFTLIGATTENPSFEVNSASLSRCQVYVLKPLNEKDPDPAVCITP
jgi:replication-associated recombination protein RarA